MLTKKDSGVASSRTSDEKKVIGDALGEGLLENLIELLGQVPRVILLILKTNDLSKFATHLNPVLFSNAEQRDRSMKASKPARGP